MTSNHPALRFGVMGCGDIAWRNMLPAMLRAGAEIAAVASRDRAKAERFADRFGGEPVGGYDELLDRSDLDAVYIALPTGLHHQWARRVLESGRHALVEKPLTSTLAEAEDLVGLARAKGLRLTDNFLFVHHSQHSAVRKMIADGLIGEPQAFSAAFGIPSRPADDIRYRADLGGGALLDLGAYTARAARLLLAGEPTVAGAMLRMDRARGVDLAGAALLAFPDGTSAELSFGFQSAYRSTYSVWGSAGRITLRRAFTPPPTLQPLLRLERQDAVEEITLPADDQFANLIRAFADSVHRETDFEPQAQALLQQAALVDRIRDTALRVDV